MQQQLSSVDTSVTQQRGATLTNNQVITAFQNTTHTQEGVIANVVGGFQSPAYLEFYPHGFSEYTKATKTQMPVFIARLKTAAAKYAAQLGEPLATNLQNFEKQWHNTRDEQQQQMGTVDDHRADRSAAETQVQMALLFAIHTIAIIFIADVAKCSSFFDFSLLYPQSHPHKSEMFTGTVNKNAGIIALNRSFSNNVHLKLTNESNNATLLVYLGATADAPSDGKGIDVDAGKSRNLKLSELGDEMIRS